MHLVVVERWGCIMYGMDPVQETTISKKEQYGDIHVPRDRILLAQWDSAIIFWDRIVFIKF